MIRTRRVQLAAVAALVLFPLAGCGGSDEPESKGDTSTSANDADGSADAEGAIRLRVNDDQPDYQEFDYPARQCRVVTTSDKSLSIDSDEVHAMLPPEPGPFDESANARVLLPDSLGDGPISTEGIEGNWSINGETAAGTLEGNAHSVGGDTEFHFTLDFACPYSG